MNTEIILGVGMFTTVILALVAFILAARSKLVSSGDVNILINGEKTITVPAGDKLLQTLIQCGAIPALCLWRRRKLCPVQMCNHRRWWLYAAH